MTGDKTQKRTFMPGLQQMAARGGFLQNIYKLSTRSHTAIATITAVTASSMVAYASFSPLQYRKSWP
jgi:hypothetical protein